MQPRAMRAVGHLIVVLETTDRAQWRDIERRQPARLLLPRIALALKEEGMEGAGDEFARLALIVGVVREAAAGQRDDGGMVEVFIPDGVEAAAALVGRPHKSGVLRLMLADDQERPAAGRLSRFPRDCRDDVFGRVVE